MNEYEDIKQRLITENWQLVNFERLGVSLHEAVRAVDDGIDWHEVEDFLRAHPSCNPDTAVAIVR